MGRLFPASGSLSGNSPNSASTTSDTPSSLLRVSAGISRTQGHFLIALASIGILLGLRATILAPLERWEYKVVPVMAEGHDRTGSAALRVSSATPDSQAISKLGDEGWDLVASYLEMETSYPNFGSAQYVTGLQPNVRPQRVVLLFKRRKRGWDSKPS